MHDLEVSSLILSFLPPFLEVHSICTEYSTPFPQKYIHHDISSDVLFVLAIEFLESYTKLTKCHEIFSCIITQLHKSKDRGKIIK